MTGESRTVLCVRAVTLMGLSSVPRLIFNRYPPKFSVYPGDRDTGKSDRDPLLSLKLPCLRCFCESKNTCALFPVGDRRLCRRSCVVNYFQPFLSFHPNIGGQMIDKLDFQFETPSKRLS